MLSQRVSAIDKLNKVKFSCLKDTLHTVIVSTIFCNCFNLVRVEVDPRPIPGTREEYTLRSLRS